MLGDVCSKIIPFGIGTCESLADYRWHVDGKPSYALQPSVRRKTDMLPLAKFTPPDSDFYASPRPADLVRPPCAREIVSMDLGKCWMILRLTFPNG